MGNNRGEGLEASMTSVSPRMVLIVDDSPQMAVNLEIALTAGSEFDVQIVTSAKEALALLNQAGCQIGRASCRERV